MTADSGARLALAPAVSGHSQYALLGSELVVLILQGAAGSKEITDFLKNLSGRKPIAAAKKC